MKDILFLAPILVCPLGMLAMGAAAWASGKLLPGRRDPATTHQPREAE